MVRLAVCECREILAVIVTFTMEVGYKTTY